MNQQVVSAEYPKGKTLLFPGSRTNEVREKLQAEFPKLGLQAIGLSIAVFTDIPTTSQLLLDVGFLPYQINKFGLPRPEVTIAPPESGSYCPGCGYREERDVGGMDCPACGYKLMRCVDE